VTLDGTEYMTTSIYSDDSRPVVLEWDRQAFAWLRQNVRGYPPFSKPIPSLSLGLAGIDQYRVADCHWLGLHQKQQRSVLPGSLSINGWKM